MKEFIRSKTFKTIAAVVGVFLVAVVSFGTGVAVGLHKARFSADFGRNYERNFMGERFDGGPAPMGGPRFFDGSKYPDKMMRQLEGRDLRNAHGLAGTVISVTDNNIIVKDKDNKENTVVVNDKTLIKSRQDDLKVSDLKADDQIVVMGSPDDNGVVNASLIRVFNNNQTN
ncbi:MAG: hypothetical protein Q8L11_03430 [Candidatus Moranbacteria bacterium]|nr:hypothetical protein [Candidatus Moranbacteria bacterium]